MAAWYTIKLASMINFIADSRDALGKAAAEKFVHEVSLRLQTKDVINVIFAAAPSQHEFLEYLCASALDWKRINAFHMDEYIGLPADAPQGFGNFLKLHLFDKVNFRTVHFINGNADDPAAECLRYAALLQEHPVDIVCMGIGENGHLAFNDPPVADFNDPYNVKVVELEYACRKQQVSDGCFATIEQVPTHAITLTIPVLLSADYISCVVPGERKAQAVYDTLYKEMIAEYPSTILRSHGHTILFTDRESSAGYQQQ